MKEISLNITALTVPKIDSAFDTVLAENKVENAEPVILCIEYGSDDPEISEKYIEEGIDTDVLTELGAKISQNANIAAIHLSGFENEQICFMVLELREASQITELHISDCIDLMKSKAIKALGEALKNSPHIQKVVFKAFNPAKCKKFAEAFQALALQVTVIVNDREILPPAAQEAVSETKSSVPKAKTVITKRGFFAIASGAAAPSSSTKKHCKQSPNNASPVKAT